MFIIETIMDKWDTNDRLSRSDTVEICPAIEENVRLITVHIIAKLLSSLVSNQALKKNCQRPCRSRGNPWGQKLNHSNIKGALWTCFIIFMEPMNRTIATSRPLR